MLKKPKIWYAICLALALIAFSMPWYPLADSVPSWTPSESIQGSTKYHKVIPGPWIEYTIGSEPYNGWDLLPLSAPCVLAFVLVLIAILRKGKTDGLALAGGTLMFIDIIFVGLLCAPVVITTWTASGGHSVHLYGTSGPLLGQVWFFAAVVSAILFGIIIFRFKMARLKAHHQPSQ